MCGGGTDNGDEARDHLLLQLARDAVLDLAHCAVQRLLEVEVAKEGHAESGAKKQLAEVTLWVHNGNVSQEGRHRIKHGAQRAVTLIAHAVQRSRVFPQIRY